MLVPAVNKLLRVGNSFKLTVLKWYMALYQRGKDLFVNIVRFGIYNAASLL